MLGPRRLAREDPLVHRLEPRRLCIADLVVRDDHEVEVTFLVGVAERERALEVRAAEAHAEDRLRALDELPEDGVQLGVDRRPGHDVHGGGSRKAAGRSLRAICSR